jgi:hypothetical protein
VKVDRVSKTLTFVTNENYKLHPCRVEFPDESEQFLTLLEIRPKVFGWMQKIESIKELRVFRLRDNKLVYSMRYVGYRAIEIQHLIEFPVLDIEYHEDAKPKEIVYLRNGFALMKSGEVISSGTVKYTLNLNEDFPLLAVT